jgi:hypothetical protein
VQQRALASHASRQILLQLLMKALPELKIGFVTLFAIAPLA